jgi:carbon-monoxide dehydrogenase medium subunit
VIAAADFFRGALMTALRPDEIVTEIRFPAWPRQRRYGFREFARRRGDFALAAAAVTFDEIEKKFRNVRVGAVGIGDRPMRVAAAERALEGGEMTEATIAGCAAAASAAVDPADDIHATAAYRKTLIGVMVERALRDAAGRPIV